MSLVRLSEHQFQAGKWAIQNAIGGLTLIWGESGSYKSFLAIHTAVCVAGGRPWFGHKVTPGPVVYVVGEGGIDQFHYRAEMAAREMRMDTVPDSLFGLMPAIDFGAEDAAIDFFEQIGDVKPALVVVDTVSRCLHGDENKQETMQGFVKNLDLIRDVLGCTVIAVHHANKEGNIRGSTVLFAAADVSVHCGKEKHGDHRFLNLLADKMKDLDTDSFYPKKLFVHQRDVRYADGDLLLDDLGSPVNTLVLAEDPKVAENEEVALGTLILLLQSRPKSRAVGLKEWYHATGMNKADFRRAVEGLMAEHRVSMPHAGQFFEGPNAPKAYDPGENYDTTEEEIIAKIQREIEEASE